MWLLGQGALPTLGPPGERLCPRFLAVRPRWLALLSTVYGSLAHRSYTEQPFYCSLGGRLAPPGSVSRTRGARTAGRPRRSPPIGLS